MLRTLLLSAVLASLTAIGCGAAVVAEHAKDAAQVAAEVSATLDGIVDADAEAQQDAAEVRDALKATLIAVEEAVKAGSWHKVLDAHAQLAEIQSHAEQTKISAKRRSAEIKAAAKRAADAKAAAMATAAAAEAHATFERNATAAAGVFGLPVPQPPIRPTPAAPSNFPLGETGTGVAGVLGVYALNRWRQGKPILPSFLTGATPQQPPPANPPQAQAVPWNGSVNQPPSST